MSSTANIRVNGTTGEITKASINGDRRPIGIMRDGIATITIPWRNFQPRQQALILRRLRELGAVEIATR